MDRTLRWFSMPIRTQISNIGGEVSRAIRWKQRNDKQKSVNFCKKAIELIRLTEKDPKNRHRIHELQSCEEELADYFMGENLYGTTDEVLLHFYDAFL